MAITDFKEGMQKFARLLTRDYGLRVVFRGMTPATDGKTIVIPEVSVLDQPNMTDEEFLAVMHFLRCIKAWVYHEGGHVIFSNFKIAGMSHYEGGSQLNAVWNIMEDQWMERQMSRRFPGARDDLAFKNEWVEAKQRREWVDEKTEPMPDKFRQIILLSWRMMRAGDKFKNDYWRMFDEEERKFVFKHRALLAKVFDCKSTRGVYKLAREWWKLIKKHLKQPEEKEKETPPPLKLPLPPTKAKKSSGDPDEEDDDSASGAGDEGGEEEKDDDQEEGGEEEKDDDQEEGGEKESEEEGDEKEESEESGGEKEEGGDGDPDEEEDDGGGEMLPPGDPLLEAMKKHMKGVVERARGVGSDFGYLVYSTDGDEIGPLPLPADAKEIGERRVLAGQLKAQLGGMFGPLTRMVQALLRSRHRSFDITGLSEGQVNQDDLHLLVTEASDDVFKTSVDTHNTEDVVVLLSADMSGSMGGPKQLLARMLFVAFAHAMTAANVKFAIHGWATGDDPVPVSKRESKRAMRSRWMRGVSQARFDECPAEDREIFSRWGNLILRVIKDFEEDWTNTGQLRIADYYAQGCNYDGESLLYGARTLLSRPEKRKILFAITDGLPSGEHLDDMKVQHDYLMEVVPQIRGVGVEVVCFGICSPGSEQYYEYEEGGQKKGFMNVNDAEQILGAVLKQLPHILSRRRY